MVCLVEFNRFKLYFVYYFTLIYSISVNSCCQCSFVRLIFTICGFDKNTLTNPIRYFIPTQRLRKDFKVRSQGDPKLYLVVSVMF